MRRIWPPLDRSSAITFIGPGINLALMEILSVITSEYKDSVSFQRDQDRIPPTLLMHATTVELSDATWTLALGGMLK